MKLKVFFITLLTLILLAMPIAAQAPQEITLTVSSDGPTKEDATKNALRSAIEQAYGAFVSANTTILNDELVKDEIVTVSNGSIKSYKEISVLSTGNGGYLITLNATVSLPHLIKYAQSHGSECEFAGNTFGMNEKIRDIQYRNAEKILENLKETVLNIKPMFDYVLKLNEPRLNHDKYLVDGVLYVKGNANTLQAVSLINNTIKELYKQIAPVAGYDIGGKFYDVNDNPSVIWMPKLDRDSWSFHKIDTWFDGKQLLKMHAENFQINDNLSSPTDLKVEFRQNLYPRMGKRKGGIQTWSITTDISGYGSLRKPYKQENFDKDCRDAKKALMSMIRFVESDSPFNKYEEYPSFEPNPDFPISYTVVPDEEKGQWAIRIVYFYFPVTYSSISMEIPKEDIGKYSKFWIEPKK